MVHLAARRPRIPPRAAPLAGGVSVLRRWVAEPALHALLDRGLCRTGAGVNRPAALSGPDVGQVHGRGQLRTTNARRPQPLVASGHLVASVAPHGGVSVSV